MELMTWFISNEEEYMRLKTVLLLLTLTIAGALFANKGFAVDVNLYAKPDDHEMGIAEIVWSVNRGDLRFFKTPEGWTDTLLFYIHIQQNGQVVIADTVSRIVELPSGSMTSESFLLFDKYSQALPVNQSWTISLTLHDLGSGNTWTVERPFWMPDFSGEIALSGLALLSGIDKVAEEGVFTKNGIQMLPNPARIFGGNFTILYYYYEIYRGENIAGDLTTRWSILYANEEVIQRSEPETLSADSPDLFILNGLNVSSLEPGKYYLTVEVSFEDMERLLQSRKSFTVPQPYEPPQYSEIGDIQLEYKYIQYFLTKSENDLFDRLTEDGKHEFIVRFWEERDTTPDSRENEIRREIPERWHTANYAYDESGGLELNGWKTDRGRIYIKFGRPNSIERNPIEMDMNSYEIWEYYNLEGGSEFIFADPRGINEWRLIHSTYPGEIFNPNWKDDLMNPHSTIPSTTNE